jgi:hypothetical protein
LINDYDDRTEAIVKMIDSYNSDMNQVHVVNAADKCSLNHSELVDIRKMI